MLTPFMFVLVCLAVFRVTRFFIHDSMLGSSLDSGSRFSMWLDRFCYYEDKPRRGMDRSWLRGKINDLLTCPFCLGFWISLATVCIVLHIVPWSLGIQGWVTVWAVAGFSVLIYELTVKLMK